MLLLNKATCSANTCVIGVSCGCINGYTGPKCEIPPVISCINGNTCRNGATCNNVAGGGITCACPPAWMGRNCEIGLL